MDLALFVTWCLIAWGTGVGVYFLIYPSHKGLRVDLWIRSYYPRRFCAVWLAVSACLSLIATFAIGGAFTALGVWLAITNNIVLGNSSWIVSGILSLLITVLILRWFFPPESRDADEPD